MLLIAFFEFIVILLFQRMIYFKTVKHFFFMVIYFNFWNWICLYSMCLFFYQFIQLDPLKNKFFLWHLVLLLPIFSL